jgi:hypothetical protein
MCGTSKEAWDLLETTHEGTNTVKRSNLQLLTSQFESLRMEAHETFMEFFTKLNIIYNSMVGLGEKFQFRKSVGKF